MRERPAAGERAGGPATVTFVPDTLIDVSRPLCEGMPAWPGDTAFRRRASAAPAGRSAVTVSSLTLSSHAGTHVDAPLHVHPEGAAVDALELWHFAGPALVLDARGRTELGPDLLPRDVVERRPRILFRTDHDAGDPRRGHGDGIPWLHPQLAAALVAAAVPLVGVDGPSVDPFGSEALEAHGILAAGGVAILEGLDLARVEPGAWVLLALPLRLAGCDGSPVRAALARSAPGD